MDTAEYDPFARGRFPVGVRTIQSPDLVRGRLFPCEIWYPAHIGEADLPAGPDAGRGAAARPGAYPLIVFSHSSGGHRRSATFLCTHLASHGYVVAALDHSEVVAEELARRDDESESDRTARIDAVIASRVPDVRFLLDHLLTCGTGTVPVGATDNGAADIGLDAARIGLVGHSFGGWTVLATPEVEPRVRAVVALGAGGSAHARPGILPLTLTFAWGRDVPTLYLAAEDDTPIPLACVYELFERTPASKRMFILRRADHQHFLDNVEGEHEAVRVMSLTGEAAWIPAAMRPIAELCSGDQAHIFVRGLTLAHLDASLRWLNTAERFLAGDVEAELAARGVEAIAHRP
jgi:dienelactone hydrolase